MKRAHPPGACFWQLLASAAVVACGGSSSTPPIETGLPETMALRDVTSADALSACQRVSGSLEARLSIEEQARRACELDGAVATDKPAECRARAKECEALAKMRGGQTSPSFSNQGIIFGTTLSCTGNIQGFATCDVTVGEYEECLNTRIDGLEQLYVKFTCDDAKSIDQMAGEELLRQIFAVQAATCQNFLSVCPQAGPFRLGAY